MSNIIKYQNHDPKIHPESFIASNCAIIGKVTIAKDVSVWYNSVLRGDVGGIEIGEGSNIQDGSVIHVDRNYGGAIIGKMVTVGHCCLLHACTVQDFAFVGMGSVVMDRAVIESHSMLAAGSLVARNKTIKSGELWAGRPARFVRNLLPEEIEAITVSANNYIELWREYLGAGQ